MRAISYVLTMLVANFPVALAAKPVPPPLDAYGDLSNIEDPAISDDGKSLALAGSFGGQRKVEIVDSGRVGRSRDWLVDGASAVAAGCQVHEWQR